jgi:heme exporter protein C
MILALYSFYALALILFTRAEILQRESKTGWVRELAQQAHPAQSAGVTK